MSNIDITQLNCWKSDNYPTKITISMLQFFRLYANEYDWMYLYYKCRFPPNYIPTCIELEKSIIKYNRENEFLRLLSNIKISDDS